jgi:membrane-associated HD superfamily phosphohydrolase
VKALAFLKTTQTINLLIVMLIFFIHYIILLHSKLNFNSYFKIGDCIEHNITSEQENDETEIDYSDENYEQNSFSKHPLEIDMLANRSEIIDSFLLKDTDSIDEISLKNEDENEETFVEDNASRKYWVRFNLIYFDLIDQV